MQINTNKSLSNLLQSGLTFLPGSVIIHIQQEEYNSFIDDTTNHAETSSLIKTVGNFRHKINAFKYSKIEYVVQKSIKDCELTEFKRYFDGENSYSFHFDLFDLDNSKCDQSIAVTSNIIKGNSVSIKYPEGDKLAFDKTGETGKTLPRRSFVILSWPFEPKDLKDIL